MNGEVEIQNVKEKAWSVCRDFLGGPWMEISLKEFGFFEVRGGLSNTLYRCVLPENATADSQQPRQVLLRIYGPIQDDHNGLVAEAVTFMLLSERKLGPKLYGLFPKGRLEEFIPSHSLKSDELRRYSLLIAREMAKIHSLDVPMKKVPDLFHSYITKWLCEVQEILQNDKGKYFFSFNEYKKEIEWIEQEMTKTNSPVVFCHNDLQGGNVLYREDVAQSGNPNLMLIDFEFGSYNYRGFDFGNHFCEWCFDYETPEFPHFQMELDKFPSRQEQIEFFNAYLDQLRKEGVQAKRPLKDEVESMLNEITLFICAANLLWSIWSAKMVLTPSFGISHRIANQKNSEETQNVISSTLNESGQALESGIIGAFKEHGKARCKVYRKFKEQYLASK